MRKKWNGGFTLIEIMIALAIVVAVGAIISLNLVSRVSTSKIKTDIQSVRVLRSALDLYEAELQTPPLTRTDTATDFGYLVTKGYIANAVVNTQSGAFWVYNNNKLYLQFVMNDSIQKAINELSADEKSLIINAD